MYLGKPKHLVKSRGVFTAEERKAIQDYILLYRSKMRNTDWEDKTPYTVEDQYSSGCSYGNGGHFSAVIDHPYDENMIIKIQIHPDDVYPLWVNLIVTGYVSKYVPEFFATGQIMGHNIYIMERVDIIAKARYSTDEVDALWQDLDWIRKEPLYQLYKRSVRDRKATCTATRILIYIKKRVDKALRGLDYWYDMHSHNWGIRKDGTLVCLDPIA